MRPVFLFVFICLSFFSSAQTLESMTVDKLYSRMNAGNDTTYIVNFWATWCKPCLEEMPYFLEEAKNRKNEPFKLLLVTLDFDTQIETRVKSYIEKNKVTEEVVSWAESDANVWIPQINEEWSGSIPATLYFRNGTSHFHEGKMEPDQLLKFISDK